MINTESKVKKKQALESVRNVRPERFTQPFREGGKYEFRVATTPTIDKERTTVSDAFIIENTVIILLI